MMKKLITCSFVIFVGILFANPIMPVCISEFTFDDSTWTMEIYDYYQCGIENLNGCSIETYTCTSYFNDGITYNENGIFIVNESDVQTPFIFDHSGDNIYFESPPSTGLIDEVSFGTYVNAPYTGQSLARFDDYFGIFPGELGFGLVKEGQPTFGFDPFDVHTSGFLEGYVYDSLMNPVENVHIDYGNYQTNIEETYTDENGFFSVYLLGKNYNFNIHLAALVSIDTTLTIEPDSTYYYEFIFENYVSSDDTEIQLPPPNYSLSNYPNPFNPTTEISFETTGLHEDARIEIYNSRGQQINQFPISNNQSSITWDGTNSTGKSCPSGVYLYKLVSNGRELAANKMLLLK